MLYTERLLSVHANGFFSLWCKKYWEKPPDKTIVSYPKHLLSDLLDPSYMKTKDDAEIGLVVERPGEKLLFIEIRSSDNIALEQLSVFSKLVDDFGDCEAVCFSRDRYAKKIR